MSAIPSASGLQTSQTQALSFKCSHPGETEGPRGWGSRWRGKTTGWLPGGGDWISVWKRKDTTGKWKRSSSQKLKTGSIETWRAEGAWGTWERHVILLALGGPENEVKGRSNQPERALAISLGLYSISDSGLWKYFMQGMNTLWIVFHKYPHHIGNYIHTLCVCMCSVVSDFLGSNACIPLGSSVHGIPQARILEWVAISFSRGSSGPRDRTCLSSVSCTGRRILYHWATWEAPYIHGYI